MAFNDLWPSACGLICLSARRSRGRCAWCSDLFRQSGFQTVPTNKPWTLNPFLVGWFVRPADLERLRRNSLFYLLFIHRKIPSVDVFTDQPDSFGHLIFSLNKTPVYALKLCPCRQTHTHTHTKRSAQSTHLQPSGADKVQLASLARLILLRERHRGHQWWQGPLMGGGNWCQKWELLLPLCSSARTASRRRGAGVIKSPSKAPVITQEIDSEIEKVCGHWDGPSPTSSTLRFLQCDSSTSAAVM